MLNIYVYTVVLISWSSLSFFYKLSSSILDVYSGEQGISPVNANLMSASCPSILPMKKEVAGNVDFFSKV